MGEAAQRRKAGLGPRPAEETAQLAAPGRDKRIGFRVPLISIGGRKFYFDRKHGELQVFEQRITGVVQITDAKTINMVGEHVRNEADRFRREQAANEERRARMKAEADAAIAGESAPDSVGNT